MPNRLSNTVSRATMALALFGLATGCSFHYSSGSSRPNSGTSQGKPAQRTGKSAPSSTTSKPVQNSGKSASTSKPVSESTDSKPTNDAPRREQPEDEAPRRNQPENDTQDPPKRTQPGATGHRATPSGSRATPTRTAPSSGPATPSPTIKANTGTTDPKGPGDMTAPK
jgi:hypothetical protein